MDAAYSLHRIPSLFHFPQLMYVFENETSGISSGSRKGLEMLTWYNHVSVGYFQIQSDISPNIPQPRIS